MVTHRLSYLLADAVDMREIDVAVDAAWRSHANQHQIGLQDRRGDIRRRRFAEAKVGGESVRVEWNPRLDTARAWVIESSGGRREVPVVPMYWFALDRHFDRIELLESDGEGDGIRSRTD